jgi:hypothetical protein
MRRLVPYGGTVSGAVFPWFQIVAGTIAFVLWAAVIPNSFILSYFGLPQWIAVAAVVIGTVVLHILGLSLRRLRPRYDESHRSEGYQQGLEMIR